MEHIYNSCFESSAKYNIWAHLESISVEFFPLIIYHSFLFLWLYPIVIAVAKNWSFHVIY